MRARARRAALVAPLLLLPFAAACAQILGLDDPKAYPDASTPDSDGSGGDGTTHADPDADADTARADATTDGGVDTSASDAPPSDVLSDAASSDASPSDAPSDAPSSDASADVTSTDSGPKDAGPTDAHADADSAVVVIAPTVPPTKVALRDEDTRRGYLAGSVIVGRAANESGITQYRVYWGTSPTVRANQTPIGVVSAPGSGDGVLAIAPGIAIPNGATYLLAVSANSAGESVATASVAVADNYSHYVDISGTLDYYKNYTNPTAAIAKGTKQLYVLFEGSYNNLVRCALDGSGCLRTQAGTTALTNLTLFLEEAAGKMTYVGIETGGGGTADVDRCNLDGTGCVEANITNYVTARHSALDAVHRRFYFPYQSISAHPGWGSCTLDGTDCGVQTFVGTGGPRAAAVDTSAGKVLLITDEPRLLSADYDGGTPSGTDISAGEPTGSATTPAAIVDAANKKLLVVGTNKNNGNRAALFRCDLSGASCDYTDISAGRPAESGKTPSAVLDVARSKLYVATENETGRPSLFRCNSDGTACTHIDIGAAQAADTGIAPQVLYDDINDRVLVVTQVGRSSDLRGGLFWIGAW